MWLGEQITARGVGNGISLIIFAGIVAGAAARAGPDPRARPHRRAVGAVHHRPGDRRGRGGRGRGLHGARAAADRRPVSQAPGRQPHVSAARPRTCRSRSTRRASSRRSSPPRCCCSRRPSPRSRARRRARLGAVDRDLSRPRPAALPAVLYRPDRLLLLLLHDRRLQPERHGRQPEEERRLRARHPAGQEHRRVSRIHPESPDRDRRALSVGGLHPARAPDRPRSACRSTSAAPAS